MWPVSQQWAGREETNTHWQKHFWYGKEILCHVSPLALSQKELPPGCPSQAHHRCPCHPPSELVYIQGTSGTPAKTKQAITSNVWRGYKLGCSIQFTCECTLCFILDLARSSLVEASQALLNIKALKVLCSFLMLIFSQNKQLINFNLT